MKSQLLITGPSIPIFAHTGPTEQLHYLDQRAKGSQASAKRGVEQDLQEPERPQTLRQSHRMTLGKSPSLLPGPCLLAFQTGSGGGDPSCPDTRDVWPASILLSLPWCFTFGRREAHTRNPCLLILTKALHVAGHYGLSLCGN